MTHTSDTAAESSTLLSHYRRFLEELRDGYLVTHTSKWVRDRAAELLR